jgi:hypothetical protein
MAQAVENTWRSIEAALRRIVLDDEGAQEVASAFYDVGWVAIDSPATTYSEAFDTGFTCSWRNAGDMVARLRGRGEDYMDWCFDAESEQVSDRVRDAMAAIGLRPVT